MSEAMLEVILLKYYAAVITAARSRDLADKVAISEFGHPLRYLSKRQACLLYAHIFGRLIPRKRKLNIGGVEIVGWSRGRYNPRELTQYARDNLNYDNATQSLILRDLRDAKKLVRLALRENRRK